jgi:ferric-dicitrate binding protein FerR (iron transport regulator)
MRLKLLCLLLVSNVALAAGKVTFVKGDFSGLKLDAKTKNATLLKAGDKILPGRSFYTQDLSHAVVKLPDGAWLRIGSDTKFELQKENDYYIIYLRTGTVRVMFAPNLQQGKTKRLVVRTEDAWIETAGAKFTMTYMPLFEHTSVYVDKGLVQVSPVTDRVSKVPTSVHGGEFSEFLKSEGLPREAHSMNERQLLMLKTLLFAQLKKTDT